MNFLNHMELWQDESDIRASKIIAAKSDEIDKDFDRAFQNSYFLPSIITNNNITKLYQITHKKKNL